MWVIVSVELHCFNWRASELLYKMACIDSIEFNWRAGELLKQLKSKLWAIDCFEWELLEIHFQCTWSCTIYRPSMSLGCDTADVSVPTAHNWLSLLSTTESSLRFIFSGQQYQSVIQAECTCINCTRLIVSLGKPLEIHFQIAQWAPCCQCGQY